MAAAGVFVSTHPDVIMKLGTKDVLVDTREMGWGSDVHRIDTLAQLRADVGRRLQSGAARVLKQWRGHSGIGVWRVQRLEDDLPLQPKSLVRLRHAQRGSTEAAVTFDEFVAQMAPYFENGGHMVDQAWQPRMTEGMVRCYLVQDRVAGFGVQAVNALYPVPAGSPPDAAPAPTTRLYHPPDLPHLQRLKRRLEVEWVPELRQRLAISHEELPMLWDCDFLPGEAVGFGRRLLRAVRDQRQQRRAVSRVGDRASRRSDRGEARGQPVSASGGGKLTGAVKHGSGIRARRREGASPRAAGACVGR